MCPTRDGRRYPGTPLTSRPGSLAAFLMIKFLRIAIITALVPAGLALLVGIVYGADRATNGGEVLGRVSVEGVELGGLGREDVAGKLADLEAELASTPIEVTVAGHAFRSGGTAVGPVSSRGG